MLKNTIREPFRFIFQKLRHFDSRIQIFFVLVYLIQRQQAVADRYPVHGQLRQTVLHMLVNPCFQFGQILLISRRLVRFAYAVISNAPRPIPIKIHIKRTFDDPVDRLLHLFLVINQCWHICLSSP
ncbi:hypothetical protein D3C77_468800 [compost metagenome]